jgi:hypothetical protein
MLPTIRTASTGSVDTLVASTSIHALDAACPNADCVDTVTGV